MARALVMLSIVYLAWRFGGADPIGLFHVSIMLAVAAVMTLATRRSFSRRSRRLPVTILVIALSWIAYGALQSIPFADAIGTSFSGPSSIDREIAAPAIGRLETAIKQLDEAHLPSRLEDCASVVPYLTRQAMLPYLLALAIMILSAVLFESRKSRIAYLWVLVGNTSLLAAWGIVQRAGGDVQILPGVENTFSDAPFSSFIYKNAGAAALLPGLAAVAALLYGWRDSRRSTSKSSEMSPTFAKSGNAFLLQPRTLTLMALAGLLAAGLIASLSRGAWFSSLAAFLVAALTSRFTLSKRHLAVLGASIALLIGSVVMLTGIGETIEKRVDRVSVKSVGDDPRWEHWKDGAAAAWFYVPSGSGLGTYGFATLPVQNEPRRTWFREAHNQYLEVLTELGVIGLALLITAIGWLATILWRLLRQDEHREKSSWGLLGLIVLLGGAIQSVFDFVLIMPANMLCYASLIGVVAATERAYASYRKSRVRNRDSAHASGQDPIQKNEMSYALYRMPAIWVGASILMIGFAANHSFRTAYAHEIVEMIRAARVDEKPKTAAVDRSMKMLEKAILLHPDRADLYRRKASMCFTKYRLGLMSAAADEGEQLEWENTQPEVLAATLTAVDDATKDTLLHDLRKSPEMKTQIALTLKNLAMSLQRNPLDPATHSMCLYVAPLAGMSVEPWIRSYARLNLNDVSALYANGLVASQNGLHDLAIDQWSKSIAADRMYLQKIFDHASESMPATDVARHLIPSYRADLFARLVKDADRQSPMLAEDVAEELIDFLNEEADFEEARIAAALASIYEAMGDQPEANLYWKEALDAENKNHAYRFHYAQSLRRCGKYEEALQQSILGATLHPDDHRFDDLTMRIRQDIGRQRDFD